MTGGLLDPEGSQKYLESWKKRIDRMAADTQAMSDRLGSLRVTAEDDNDLVEVTIDSSGALVDLTFTQRIRRTPPEAVARAVLRALRTARLTAAERSREIITETLGSDSVAGRTIAERMEQQLRGEDDSHG
jgi:DNA-binding protein YbaB